MSVFIVFSHELGSVRLGRGLESRRDLREPREDRLHVAARLHGDDPAVVLLVDPAQSRLGVVVEDTAVLTQHNNNGNNSNNKRHHHCHCSSNSHYQ